MRGTCAGALPILVYRRARAAPTEARRTLSTSSESSVRMPDTSRDTRPTCGRGYPGRMSDAPPSTASTPSSPPAASAAGCGRCPAPTRRSSCTTSPAPARRCCGTPGTASRRSSGERADHGRDRPRAPRGGRGAAARHRRHERRARERAARLDRRHRARRRHPRAPRARRHHRLVRRRPRDPRHAAASSGPCAGGRGGARGLHRARSASRRPSRRSASATSKCGELGRVDGAPERARWSRASSRSPTSRRPSAYLADGDVPVERGHVHRAAPTCCSSEIAEHEARAATPGSMELAEAWDDPATRGPAVDRIWPTLDEDRDRLRRRRAGRRRGPPRRHPRALRLGRRRRLRVPRQAQLARARRATWRSSARTPGSSPTRRAASS